MSKLQKILLGIAAFFTALAGSYGGSQLGASRLNHAERTVMDEVATTTVSSAFNVADFDSLTWTVATTDATGTIKFDCSTSDTAPDFSSAASATNRYDVVDVTDLEDESSIDGDTGISLAGTTDVRQFQMDSANFRWCGATFTRTSGTSTIKLLGAINN